MAFGEQSSAAKAGESPDLVDPFDWPVFGLQDDVRPALARALTAGRRAALATLHAVEGGAPRGVGAQMLFDGRGMTGFLSGGCIEADVASHAAASMADGLPRRLVYGDGGPVDIRLPCGSRIEVLVEAINADDPAARRLIDLGQARRPALWLSNGRQRACFALDDLAEALPASLAPALESARQSPATAGSIGEPFALYRRHQPPLRLAIVGGDPIALALARLARDMGIETDMVRPKGPVARPPVEDARYHRDFDAAMAASPPDAWTALAVLTHDAEQEHSVLRSALATDAGYVGALGSRRRIPERLARLRADGAGEAALARLHAPIGLPIGGKSPWAIAVSILAEIVAEIGDRAD